MPFTKKIKIEEAKAVDKDEERASAVPEVAEVVEEVKEEAAEEAEEDKI